MLELGSEEERGHRRVGTRAAHVVDLLITYGPRSKTTAAAARIAGLRPEQVLEANTLDEILTDLSQRLRPDDDVLVKGSLAMGMSAIVRGLRAPGEG
jgi:UDP-N-acetylmuramoyl-tripeptide--D-alanyl-D-alanine ligase